RRRWERRDVTWAARFLVGEGSAFAARAVDASRHGLRLVLEGSAPVGLANGQKCCVEVHLAGSSARFVRDAEVCHVDERGIGLIIPEALPAGILPGGGDGIALGMKPRAAEPATRPRLRVWLFGLLGLGPQRTRTVGATDILGPAVARGPIRRAARATSPRGAPAP